MKTTEHKIYKTKWNTQFESIKYALEGQKATSQQTSFAYTATPFPKDDSNFVCLKLKISFGEKSDKGFDVAIKNYESINSITF